MGDHSASIYTSSYTPPLFSLFLSYLYLLSVLKRGRITLAGLWPLISEACFIVFLVIGYVASGICCISPLPAKMLTL